MALSHGWTVGLEYRHYDFEDKIGPVGFGTTPANQGQFRRAGTLLRRHHGLRSPLARELEAGPAGARGAAEVGNCHPLTRSEGRGG